MRIVVLGAGSIGKRRIGLLRNLCPDAELTAVDPDPARKADLPDGVRFAESWDHSVAWDAVLDCSPPANRGGVLQWCVQHRVPVFLEKPVATPQNVDLVRHNLRQAEEQGLVVQAGHNLFCHPYAQRMHDLVSKGALGWPIVHTGRYGYQIGKWRPGHPIPPFSLSLDAGGGVLMECVQDLALTHWWSGGAVPWGAEAVCTLAHVGADLPEAVPDCAALSIWNFRAAPQYRAYLHLDLLRPYRLRQHEIAGPAGLVVWGHGDTTEWLEVRLEGADPVREEHQSTELLDDSYRHEVELFLEWIRTGEKPRALVDTQYAWEATKWAMSLQAQFKKPGALSPVVPKR